MGSADINIKISEIVFRPGQDIAGQDAAGAGRETLAVSVAQVNV